MDLVLQHEVVQICLPSLSSKRHLETEAVGKCQRSKFSFQLQRQREIIQKFSFKPYVTAQFMTLRKHLFKKIMKLPRIANFKEPSVILSEHQTESGIRYNLLSVNVNQKKK